MWSAAVDPRVLTARTLRGDGLREQFGARSATVRVVRGTDCEHVLLDRRREPIRLDVFEGTRSTANAALQFELADDDRLEAQMAALRCYRSIASPRRYSRLIGRLQALHATDARNAGASLREIAELLLGPGDWPGDGEHRKSVVRRLIVTGDTMINGGPRPILSLP